MNKKYLLIIIVFFALLVVAVSPVIQEPVITPAVPGSYDDLLGYCNATDADGDTVGYSYKWYKDSVLQEESNFVLTGELSHYLSESCTGALNIHYIDNRIFAPCTDGLKLYNYTNGELNLLDSDSGALSASSSAYYDDGYVYVANRTSGIIVFNVTDSMTTLSAPLDTFTKSFYDIYTNIIVDNNIIYSSVDEALPLISLNATDKTNLVELDTLGWSTSGAGVDLSLYGNTLFFSDTHSLLSINVTDPSNMELIVKADDTTSSTDHGGLFVDYPYIYHARTFGVEIYNASDITNIPRLAVNSDYYGARSVVAVSNFLVANYQDTWNDGGLYLFNVTDKTNIQFLQVLENNSFPSTNLQHSNGQLFTTAGGDIDIYNLSLGTSIISGLLTNVANISSVDTSDGENWTLSCMAVDSNGDESSWLNNSVIITAPPTQSSWSPAKGSTIYADSQTVTFTLNKNGDCKWSLTDQAYDDMTNDCTGDGTTSMSCATTGLATGSEIIYFACQDTDNVKDTAGTNEHYDLIVNDIPPEQSGWSPAKSANIYTASPTVTFNLDKNGDCKWSLSDQSYDDMSNDCTGDGTTSMTCAVSGLSEGTDYVYTACQDSFGNKDSIFTNEQITYVVDSLPPVQSGWSPAKSATIGSSSQTITFDLDETGDCKWSLTDQAYGDMAGDCTGDGTTSQSCSVTGMVDGSEIVYLACSDGNNDDSISSNEHVDFTIDTTPPTQSSWNPAKSATITTTSPTLTFTTNENADCKWSLSDQAYTDMINDCTGDGTTSQTCVTSGLSQGSEIVYTACKDTVGIEDTALSNEHIDFTVDSVLPTQSAHNPANGASILTTSPTVTFTTNENADCKWSLTDQAYGDMAGDCTGDGTTSQSCATSGLVGGTEIVYFSCQDTAGNQDTTGTNTEITYDVDTVPPTQSNWVPAKASTLISTSQTLTFNTNENADCKWSLTDQAYASMSDDCTGDGTTSQSCPITGMIEGAEIVYLACNDTTGNEDSIATNEHVDYTIDLSPPTQSSHNPAKSTTIITDSPTITFTTNENADCKWALTDIAYATMTNDCTGDGTTSQSCITSGLIDGSEIVYVACQDDHGNEDTISTNEHVDYTVDTTPPSQSSWSPAKSATVTTTAPTITFNLDGNGDCKWSLSDLAYDSMAGDCTGDGTTSITCATSGLVEGAEIVYTACQDSNGVKDTILSNEHIDYTVDASTPIQSNWVPAKSATIYTLSPTITFDLDKVGDCKWSLSDQSYSAMSNDCTGDGTTSMTCVTSGLVEGSEIVYTACQDGFSNQDSAFTNTHIPYTVNLFGVDTCRNITVAGTYTLTDNLVADNATCIDIQADDVILNGDAYSIDCINSDESDIFGIYSGTQDNITINNIKITNQFEDAIYFNTLTNVTISSSVLNDTIRLFKGSSFNINNNVFVNYDDKLATLQITGITDITGTNSIYSNTFTMNSSAGSYTRGEFDIYNNVYNASGTGRGIYADGSHNNIYGNNITVSAENVYGLGTITGINYTIYNNIINVSGSGTSGIYVSDTVNSTFNNINSESLNNYSILIIGSSGNNNFTVETLFGGNGSIQDETGSATNNSVFVNSSFGKISWLNLDNLTITNEYFKLTNPYYLQNNLVGWESAVNNNNYNTTATIQIKGLAYVEQPYLLKGGVRCDNETYCTIDSYTGGILTATVDSFSNYTSTEASTEPEPEVDPEEGGGGGTPPECTKDGDCKAGFECKNNKCVAKPVGSCTKDSDCQAGFECLNNECTAEEEDDDDEFPIDDVDAPFFGDQDESIPGEEEISYPEDNVLFTIKTDTGSTFYSIYVAPGNFRERSIYVTNKKDAVKGIELFCRGDEDICKWLELDESVIDLEVDEIKQVYFKVRVPEGTEYDSYKFEIVGQYKTASASLDVNILVSIIGNWAKSVVLKLTDDFALILPFWGIILFFFIFWLILLLIILSKIIKDTKERRYIPAIALGVSTLFTVILAYVLI